MTVSLGENIHAGDVRVGTLRFEDGTAQTTAGGGGASYDATNRLDAAFIGGGNVSDTEFDYLNGVTSSIQTQLTAATATANAAQPALDANTRLDAAFIGGGNVSDTEFEYLNGVTSSIQTQLDSLEGGIANNAQNISDKITQPSLIANPNTGGLNPLYDNQTLYHDGSNWDTKPGLPITSRFIGVGHLDSNGNVVTEGNVPISLTLTTGEGFWPVFLHRDSKIAVNGTITEIGSNLVPTRSATTAGHVLTTDGTNMSWAAAGGGGAVYFSGRLTHGAAQNLTTGSTSNNFTFNQLTSLSAISSLANNSSNVTWNNGVVTIPETGIYSVQFGVNITSTANPASIERLYVFIQKNNDNSNGSPTALFSSRYWRAGSGNDAFVNQTWLGSLSQGDTLKLYYNIGVSNNVSNGAIATEYTTSVYGEYGKTYLSGFKIA